jgi:hypothetical protein
MISDRPEKLTVDDLNLPHCDDGPFCRWRDGSALYSVHGVRVPWWVVEHPDRITIEHINKQDNAEIRRVMIERFGWPRYLAESGAKRLDRRFNDRDQQWEEVYSVKDGSRRALVCDPSTGRKYALGVPYEVNTCEQMQNWMSHGLDRFAIHRS